MGASVPYGKITSYAERNSLLSLLLSQEVLHGCGFAVLTWVMCFDFIRAGRKAPPYLLIGLLAAAYGVIIECWHLLLPYRSFEIYDMGIDIIGCLTGLIIFYFFRRVK